MHASTTNTWTNSNQSLGAVVSAVQGYTVHLECATDNRAMFTPEGKVSHGVEMVWSLKCCHNVQIQIIFL